MFWKRTLCVCAALALSSTGCANLMTSRAIDVFARNLAEGDTEQLRSVSSERFAQQALRLPEAGDDLKVLNVPKGKLTVLKTEDVSENKKHVTVQVGESDKGGQILEYHLTRQPGQYRWVVDDVFITQNRQGRSGPVTKSLTEQMDLLLTVREFLAAWKSGTRDEVLAISADELRSALADLPPTYLQQLTSDTVGGISTRSMRPEARIDGERAVVMVSRSRGNLMISLARQQDRWQVTDVAADARDGTSVASVRVMAGALQTAVRFLNAYSAADRTAMSAVSDPAFDKKLAGADLSTVPLPVVGMLAAGYKYLHHGDTVDLVVSHGAARYVVTLKKKSEEAVGLPNKLPTYLVSEVTLYEEGTSEVKLLSSVFTVHAVVEVFADALIARDRTRLMVLSTADFNERAWSATGDVVLQAIPLPDIEAAPPRVVATVFQGPLTEVTVTQGSKALTYVLRSSRNGMLVDDVLLPVSGRSNSLKANVELLAPLYGFALGIYHHDMELLKRTSGSGLTRMVWSQTQSVPDVAGFRVVDYLAMPVKSIKTTGDRTLIELSDGRRTARAILSREGRHIVVQDVQLSAGEAPGQQVELLQALRQVIAERNTLIGGGIRIPRGTVHDNSAGPVVPASREVTKP